MSASIPDWFDVKTACEGHGYRERPADKGYWRNEMRLKIKRLEMLLLDEL